MDIFESLENLNVSEECFDEIMGLVEEVINEGENLLKIAAKHGASRNLKKRAYEQPSDTDGYGEYDEERGPMSVQAPPKGRGNLDTKNLRGQLKTDLRREEPSLDIGLQTRREIDAKNGYRDAIKKSVERHEKKNKVSESLYNEIINRVYEDLSSLAQKKWGYGSAKSNKADDLWNKAYDQAQNYFSSKGANHDLSTNNDKGVDKFDEDRLKKVEKREKGRTEYLKKNIQDLLKGENATKGVIPKMVTKDSSLYAPNTNMNPNNPESGLSKAKRRHEDRVAKTKLYAKDGDNAHTLANESLYNEIADLVEDLLSEEGFLDKVTDKITNSKNKVVSTLRKTPLVKNTIGKRAVQRAQDNLRNEIHNAKAYTNSQIEYNKARGANPSAGYKDAAQQGQGDVSAAKDHYLGVGDRYGFKKNELLK